MTKTANDVAPKLLPRTEGLLKRTLYKIGTYLVKISTTKQNAEQEQNTKNTDTPDKNGSQLEALVSCCPKKTFKLTKENENFVKALIKMRDLIALDYYYRFSTGHGLPFYEYYEQKYYNEAHL